MASNHKRNISGLKPFKKGQSGNPKGKPPKLPNLDILLAEVIGEEGYKEIIEALKQDAKTGKGTNKVRAAEILLDRGYGKAKQHVDITSTGEQLVPQIIIKPIIKPNAD